MSVVLPVRNAAGTIEEQLRALSSQSFERSWELIVVDNGSTDGSVERVECWRERLPDLRFVESPIGEGAYGARNKGARSSRASRIAFCDADDVVADGWLEAVARGLDEFSLVTGPLDLRRLNSSDVVGWRTRTLWDRPLDWHAFLPVALNCNLAIRREVFDVIGGFRLVDSGSDFRFVWEAQLRGWKLGYSPGALVHRREPASWRAFLRRSFRDGRHEPQLYKDFRRSGMPRSSLTRAAMFWLLLALGAPALCVSRWRYAWSAAAGMRAGRLVGSVRSRVMYL